MGSNQTETLVTYDALDQIVKLDNRCSGCGEDISVYKYTYDEAGNRISESYGNEELTYTYDVENRLRAISDGENDIDNVR